VEYNRPNVNFCNGDWYQVEVVITSVTVRLTVNNNNIEMMSSAFSRFVSADTSESFYIGGINSEYHTCTGVSL